MNQTTVYTFAKWQVKEGKLDTVLLLLGEVAKQTIQEKGNLLYKVHQSLSDANTLLLYEAYTNQAAVEEHRNAAYFQNLVVGRIVPELENREVILASGIEWGE